MMNKRQAIMMAQLFAEIAADASGVACVCMLGPCNDGVRWVVVTAESGAHIAAGEVAIALEAGDTLPTADEVKCVAAGRN